MSRNEDEENLSISSDDDEDSSSSSSTTSTDDDDDDDDENDNDDGQIEDDSDDNLATLPLKQAYSALETKRKSLNKRLIELRDELKAQPQADIETKKRLLTEIKNLREKWIANQTRLTNLKARLSHSPTPERKIRPKSPMKKSPEKVIESETRIIPPPRVRTRSYSSSSRSRSRSRSTVSSRSSERSYRDLDALDDYGSPKARDTLSSRPTTSYRDLTENYSVSRSPSPSAIDELPSFEPKISDENLDETENLPSTETFYNQTIPYPVVNDKRDLEVINRQLKNQLRQLEASRSNPVYDQQSSLIHYEHLKKQNDFINLRLRIEKLKKHKGKTQKEKEQNKKQFHLLLQEFRKLQRFMRSANRDSVNNQFLTFDPTNFPSSIPLPSSPPPNQTESVQPTKQQSRVPPPPPREQFKLPPLDLMKVTGKKIVFESSDSDDDEQPTTNEPQVPVALSASEPRTVPDQLPPLPIPSNSSSSAALDAIKTRVANLMQTSNSASTTKTKKEDDDEDEDEDEDNDEQPVQIANPERTQAISAKFNRKRRKTKRNRNKKKNTANSQANQQTTNENDAPIVDQEEAWKRHVALQLQSTILKVSNPILRALTTEAYKKLGISQEEVNEFQFDDEMMDYETALILQQQQEFLAAAAANPFNVLHNAAVGNSSSRPNLVDILSNLNGGITPSSSEPQTPMGLLQKFFLDANNNPNADQRSRLNDLSSTPPTPPSPRDISIGKKIVESLTHQDINALLKLSGSEHDDDEDDEDENDNHFYNADTDDDDDIHQFSFDEDSNDMLNGNNNNNHINVHEKWEQSVAISSNRNNQTSNLINKKSTIETLILPSFNRCTHLGKATKRSAGIERTFPSFSKHNAGPVSALNLILYGLSSTP